MVVVYKQHSVNCICSVYWRVWEELRHQDSKGGTGKWMKRGLNRVQMSSDVCKGWCLWLRTNGRLMRRQECLLTTVSV